MRNIVAAELDVSGLHRLKSGDAVDELGLAVAVNTGDADDLARVHVERHALDGVVVVHLGGDGHLLDAEHNVAGLGLVLMYDEFDVAADHHAAEFFFGRVLDVDGADAFALAQNGDSVRDGHDLVELVGNEEYALAFGGEVLHYLHQFVDLLRGEHGGRLVEDEYLVVAVEHLKYLGALLHTDGDVLDKCVRIDGEAVFFGQRHNLFPRLLLLQEAVLVRLNAENDVVEHGEALDQLEVLMHHADAEGVSVVRVLDLNLDAVFFDDALLSLIQAEKHAHQSRFARTVFAEQSVDLALPELKRDIVVGDDAGESLGDVKHLYCVWSLQQSLPP